ncbi:hypothetical protein CAPTEDRAFT_211772 [Capitella teleta]|uniref:Fucosyltransferase n=1 Tax=Capitella teleta TaxID=283909 RepID=R7T4K7_CAPTE|nr:hypothetical protein CAPTEDRAFT_211772 [Capitella teleta]|eukprot:ELT87751.1 hypothetical protein CAPTEDRAFT_211772 [Capitella teleta]
MHSDDASQLRYAARSFKLHAAMDELVRESLANIDTRLFALKEYLYQRDYVHEMQKYIDIDIFRGCDIGEVCGKYREFHIDCVNRFIKFYFGFENSLCQDYYTEKLTKTIGLNVIPVVMGLVNYSSILTSGTFIDVRDFQSVEALTDYLSYLDNNNTAFNEIIERRRASSTRVRVKCAIICIRTRTGDRAFRIPAFSGALIDNV